MPIRLSGFFVARKHIMKEKKLIELHKKILADALDTIMYYQAKVINRCLIEGCRYGTFEGEPLKDNCIYCGKRRIEYSSDISKEMNKSIEEMINKSRTLSKDVRDKQHTKYYRS